MGGTLGRRSARTDRWLWAVGVLLAWAAVAAAVMGTLQHAGGPAGDLVALVVTLCACVVLLAWVLAPTSPPAPPRASRVSPLHREATRIPVAASPEARSAPPTAAMAHPMGSAAPLVMPRPLYAADELTPASAAGEYASPFLNDALFQLEDPGPGARLLRVGKDPTQLCQDSFACDAARRVYAVTDGVSRSFMPAAWARIVAHAAVAQSELFAGEAEFAAFLDAAADRWRAWMREVWQPRVAPGDWSAAIDGQGAQTTLVCCSIGGHPLDAPVTAHRQPADAGATRGETGPVRVDVTAIGDAECLLFRQGAERWELVAAFPLEHPADFGAAPATLSTRRDPARIAAMYRNLRRSSFDALPGDRLALATDAVACWLLAQAHKSSASFPTSVPSVPAVQNTHTSSGEDPIAPVLDDPAVLLRVAQVEIDAGRLEDDDLTLLVIAIP